MSSSVFRNEKKIKLSENLKYSPKQIPKNQKKYPKYLNTRKDSRFYSKFDPINLKISKCYTNI